MHEWTRNGGSSEEEEVALLELLDRILDKGVVVSGDITLSVSEVDLVYVGLRVLISAIDTPSEWQAHDQRRAEPMGAEE